MYNERSSWIARMCRHGWVLYFFIFLLTLMHSERPKLYAILVFLRAVVLKSGPFRGGICRQAFDDKKHMTKHI